MLVQLLSPNGIMLRDLPKPLPTYWWIPIPTPTVNRYRVFIRIDQLTYLEVDPPSDS